MLVTIVSVGCILFIILLDAAGKSDHWFNTILCFPAGMILGINSEKVKSAFGKKTLVIANFLITAVICLLSHKLPGHVDNSYIRILLFEIKSIAFAWGIVSATWVLAIGNPILTWLGSYVFEIYILQRIPMILFQNIIMNRYLYFVICLVSTLVMAVVFKKVERYIDSMIDRKLDTDKSAKITQGNKLS